MTLFFSTHQAPSLEPDEVAGYVPEIKKNIHAQFQQCFIDLEKGYIVTIYEADSEAALRDEFGRIGWPVDSVNELTFSIDREGLDAIPS